MSGALTELSHAPVAFGRLAVPLLFRELLQPEAVTKIRALNSLCNVVHDPEQLYHTVNGGFVLQLKVLLKDEDPSVRRKTCELLYLLSAHSLGRQAVLASSLLAPLCELLDDSSSSCRRNVLRVLSHLILLPAGAEALLAVLPKLMLLLRQQQEEQEEEEVLLLSIISCCSRLDCVPALSSDGISLLRQKLTHRSTDVRREAAAALMALSVSVHGKQLVCEKDVLPVLVSLLQDEDIEVKGNAAGVIMNTVILTAGKQQCLGLDVIPVLLTVLSETPQEEDEERKRRRKALLIYSLRALTALAEAPEGRSFLLKRLPLLVRRSEETDEEDQDVRQAAQTAISVITWTP